MSLRFAALAMLVEGPLHGYELKARFDEVTGGFWELNYGQVYSVLDRLEREGLVEGEWVQPAFGDRPKGGRERRIYRITPRGLDALERWRRSPVERARPLRDEIFLRLAAADRSRLSQVLDLLQQQRQVYLKKMAQITHQKLKLRSRTPDAQVLLTGLIIDAALFHAEADLRWIDLCEARLRDWLQSVPAKEGLPPARPEAGANAASGVADPDGA